MKDNALQITVLGIVIVWLLLRNQTTGIASPSPLVPDVLPAPTTTGTPASGAPAGRMTPPSFAPIVKFARPYGADPNQWVIVWQPVNPVMLPGHLQMLIGVGVKPQIWGVPWALGKTVAVAGIPAVYSSTVTLQAEISPAVLPQVQMLPFVKEIDTPSYGFVQ